MKRFLVALTVLGIAASLFAQAPMPQPQLTWVRFLKASPGHYNDAMTSMTKFDFPVLDKLLADGKIAGWGLLTPLTISGQNFNFAFYVTVMNWAAVDDVVAALDAAGRAAKPEEMAKMDASFEGEATRDFILRHALQSPAPPPSFMPKYVRVSYYTVKPERAAEMVGLIRNDVAPTLNDMAAKGTIGIWGFSTQEVLTDPTWTHMLWVFTKDLASFDGIRSGLMAMPQQARDSIMVRMRDMTDPMKARSEILRVVRVGTPK